MSTRCLHVSVDSTYVRLTLHTCTGVCIRVQWCTYACRLARVQVGTCAHTWVGKVFGDAGYLSRHRSLPHYVAHVIAGLIAYSYQAKKPSLNLNINALAIL